MFPNEIMKYRLRKEMPLPRSLSLFSLRALLCLVIYFHCWILIKAEEINADSVSTAADGIAGAVPAHMTTQTVYGFLDFTTTMGNTVMVFSPQSSSVAGTGGQQPNAQESTTIINEKPTNVSLPSTTTPNIQPSKTLVAAQSASSDAGESKAAASQKHSENVDRSNEASTPAAAVKVSTSKNSSSVNNATTPRPKDLTKSTSKGQSGNEIQKSAKQDKSSAKSKITTTGSKVDQSTAHPPPATPNLKPKKLDKDKSKATTAKAGKDVGKGAGKEVGKEIGKEAAKEAGKSTGNGESSGSAVKNSTKASPSQTPKVIGSKVEVRVLESTESKPDTSKLNESKPNESKPTELKSNESKLNESKPNKLSDDRTKHVSTLSASSSNETKTSPSSSDQASSLLSTLPMSSDETKSTTLSGVSSSSEKAIVQPTSEEPAVISSNSVVSPEYDFLSRQPSEVVDETFKVIELRPNQSGKYPKPKNTAYHRSFGTSSSGNQYPIDEDRPTGLISSLSDTVVRDGLTTVYETNVIGTVVSGKYAQVLQSSSHVTGNQKKIKPTSALSGPRILKTAAPSIGKSTKSIGNNLESAGSSVVYDSTNSDDADFVTAADASNNHYTGSATPAKFTKKAASYTTGTSSSLSSSSSSGAKNRFYPNSAKNGKTKEDFREDYGTTAFEEDESSDTEYTVPGSNITPSPQNSPSTNSYKKATTKANKALTGSVNKVAPKFQNNRFARPSSTTPELATVSVFSETVSSVTPSSGLGGRRFTPSSSRKTTPKIPYDDERTSVTTKRNYKQKIAPFDTNNNNNNGNNNNNNNNVGSNPSSPTYKFKLSRPTGRWQYKTSPKPRVTIRRQDDLPDNVTVNPISAQFTPDVQLDSSDQELSGSGLFPALHHEDNSIVQDITPSLTAETIRVEISTPADFKDVYYEIATIKSPYSFQVGTVKNTRFITVTSTFEKNLLQTSDPVIAASKTEPLTENLLATATHYAYGKEEPPLDSSIATLPPIGLAGNAETPPLETLTESFSTTQLMLKTHILPVVRGGSDTTKYTLIQSYHVTRLVTATKTLPPMEVYQFVPSKTLNEFNTRLDEAGSELHLDLDFADNENNDEDNSAVKLLLNDLDLTNVGSNFDLSDVDKTKLLENHLRAKKAHKITTPSPPPSQSPTSENPTTPALSPEQLQQLALLRLLNPNAAVPNVLTSSKPIIKVETAYETHILPIFNGASTFFTTISRPTATLTKTDFEFITSTLPLLQPSAFNPLFPQQPSFHVTTTPLVTSTLVTETDSKVLKLTFGAKTSYTTLLSTRVTPTVLTTYLTNSIPVQPTAATFPGFFNPPYVPFQFMG